jgi:hypothetical protein
MMKNRWREMEYYDFLNCWVVDWFDDHRGYEVHCGDSFKLYLDDGKILSCRIELGQDWYIIVGQNGTEFYLKPNETYRVII